MGISWRYCRLMLIPLGILAASGAGGGGSYESIASATGTGSSGVITFSSIPSTYKHLQIRMIARDNTAATHNLVYINFNGDTGNNYSFHFLRGNGSAASASGAASAAAINYGGVASGTAATIAPTITDIIDYASTSKYKTTRSITGFDDNTNGNVWLCSGLWQSTSAVNSLTLTNPSANFTTTSIFALYGIKGA
jgi:hypothetical protein